MKNSLEKFISENGMSEIKAINLLQGAGIVSDNAIWPGDVAECNFPEAKKFLTKYLPKDRRN